MPWAVPETVSPGKLMFDGVSLVKTTSEAPGTQGIRKRIEEAFSWPRTVARFAQDAALRVAPRSIGNSPSSWPPMISSACQIARPARAVSPWTSTRHCQVGRF